MKKVHLLGVAAALMLAACNPRAGNRISLTGTVERDIDSLSISVMMPKIRAVLNDEDTIENLKKKIELLKELINSNALAQLEEYNKRKYRHSVSRQNSFFSMKYNNKNKSRKSTSRRPSNYNCRVLTIGTNRENKNLNYEPRRKQSTESSFSNTCYLSNNLQKKKAGKDKSSVCLNKFNLTN